MNDERNLGEKTDDSGQQPDMNIISSMKNRDLF